ncbi:hypothetical protein LTR53_011425 [Teratosphaeriaceae sp. CCFEE 6253]|nr:hypothetical protein LTR53_011425 [Teratosphaeriaceae sp. CCFEE 6253]
MGNPRRVFYGSTDDVSDAEHQPSGHLQSSHGLAQDPDLLGTGLPHRRDSIPESALISARAATQDHHMSESGASGSQTLSHTSPQHPLSVSTPPEYHRDMTSHAIPTSEGHRQAPPLPSSFAITTVAGHASSEPALATPNLRTAFSYLDPPRPRPSTSPASDEHIFGSFQARQYNANAAVAGKTRDGGFEILVNASQQSNALQYYAGTYDDTLPRPDSEVTKHASVVHYSDVSNTTSQLPELMRGTQQTHPPTTISARNMNPSLPKEGSTPGAPDEVEDRLRFPGYTQSTQPPAKKARGRLSAAGQASTARALNASNSGSARASLGENIQVAAKKASMQQQPRDMQAPATSLSAIHASALHAQPSATPSGANRTENAGLYEPPYRGIGPGPRADTPSTGPNPTPESPPESPKFFPVYDDTRGLNPAPRVRSKRKLRAHTPPNGFVDMDDEPPASPRSPAPLTLPYVDPTLESSWALTPRDASHRMWGSGMRTVNLGNTGGWVISPTPVVMLPFGGVVELGRTYRDDRVGREGGGSGGGAGAGV